MEPTPSLFQFCYGKQPMPIDTESKAKTIRLFSIAAPYMRAFHLNWFAFMLTFISTFAPAALLPVIRESLFLSKTDVGNAGIAAVCGAIASRVMMGNMVDTFGPRYGFGFLLLLTAPAIYCMSMVQNAIGFIIARLFIGFSLAAFVCCQFWCTSMFNTKIVGSANAIAAGWGNMGGGVTHFLMPLIWQGISKYTPPFIAWRWSFFVPASAHVMQGILIMLFSQDLPLGNYRDLIKANLRKKDNSPNAWKAALLNYRTWIMCLNYGYCFGIELVVDNVITYYLYDQFRLNPVVAGAMGSIFGMMNIFSRGSGGMISDLAARYYGMRGRLWALWIIQTLGGVFCILLGITPVYSSLTVTMIVLVIFSIWCQQACGLSCGVVPFVSKRSTGLVYGMVGAGGNTGAAVTQAIFFTYLPLTSTQGFFYMGIMVVGMTALYTLVYFPMWGGMFCGAKPGVTEEDYYLSEYTQEEIAAGLHTNSIKFAFESQSERGWANAGKTKNVDDVPAPVKPVVINAGTV
jgi:MFS transporter, NNP family, nitrate/nitrite transporter